MREPGTLYMAWFEYPGFEVVQSKNVIVKSIRSNLISGLPGIKD
jgi:hypothetical protein